MTFKTDIIDDIDTILVDWDDVIWNGVIYKGIFHNEYEAASLFEGEIESKNPFVQVRESDFSAITHADTVTINSVVYKIMAIEPDGMGMMVLKLSKD